MEIAKIKINGTNAEVSDLKTITSGMVGATVSITYDDTWDGLNKQVVFKTAFKTINADGTTIPHELLTLGGTTLKVGVYGYTDDGTIAIPTVYADLGRIKQGADPEGDEASKPTLPVWARMQSQIAALESAAEVIRSILPAVTAEDVGKALVVSADGRIVADDGMVEQDVLAEQVLTFSAPDPEYPENPYVIVFEENPIQLQVGATYYVVWDGTVYPCVAANLDDGEAVVIYIGNLGVVDAGEDSGEPFLLANFYNGDTLAMSAGYTNSPDLTLAEVSHTVRIYQMVKAAPYYTKAEIDTALGSYINDVDTLIGDVDALLGGGA